MCEAALAPMHLWGESGESDPEHGPRLRGIEPPNRLDLTTLSAEVHLCALEMAATFTRETHKQVGPPAESSPSPRGGVLAGFRSVIAPSGLGAHPL